MGSDIRLVVVFQRFDSMQMEVFFCSLVQLRITGIDNIQDNQNRKLGRDNISMI